MIKIIEYGTIKKQRCNNCGCLFSYEEEDVKERTINDSFNSLGGVYCTNYVVCPQCKKSIDLTAIRKVDKKE